MEDEPFLLKSPLKKNKGRKYINQIVYNIIALGAGNFCFGYTSIILSSLGEDFTFNSSSHGDRGAIIFILWFLTCPISGRVADVYGRRRVNIFSAIVLIASLIIMSASVYENYPTFYTGRALHYVAIGTDLTITGRTATEISRPKTRGYFLGCIYFMQVIGGIIMKILIFALTPKYLTKLCTKIMFAGCIPFAIVALIMRSKMPENQIYLESRVNMISLREVLSKFKKDIIGNCILAFCCTISVSITAGLDYVVPTSGASTFISGVSTIPGFLATIGLLETRLGRKKLLTIEIFISILIFTTIGAIPSKYTSQLSYSALSIMTSFAVGGPYLVCYVLAFESFPTQHGGFICGLVSAFSALGYGVGYVALLVSILKKLNVDVSFLLLLSAGALLPTIPSIYWLITERAGKPLPLEEFQTAKLEIPNEETKEESKNFGNHVIRYMDIRFYQRLGSGAFGVVFKGKYKSTSVAIKLLQNNNLSDMKSFLAEAQLMMELPGHPNVVLFRGITVPPDPVCIVMDYCAGGSLWSYLEQNRGKLSFTRMMELAVDIARGMRHLHEGIPNKELIHRDLAARNILLKKDGSAAISDFGLAKVKGREWDLKTNALGPLKWMAPESAKDHVYSRKSDVFSYGVVLFEITTQQEPWKLFTGVQAVTKVIVGERMEIPEQTPTIFRDLMKSCWEQNPDLRPTFEQILQRIDVENEEDENIPTSTLNSGHSSIIYEGHSSNLESYLMKPTSGPHQDIYNLSTDD